MKSARRREELRRNLPKPALDVRSIVARPEFANTAIMLVVTLLVASMLVIWSRDQLKIRDGQIMTETRLRRLTYRVEDTSATETRRVEARKSAPQVWNINTSYLERLQASLNGLPIAAAGKSTIAELAEELRQTFALTEETLAALQPFAREGETAAEWKRWVAALDAALRLNPLVASDQYQNHWAPREYSRTLKRLVRDPSGGTSELRGTAIELTPETDPELDRRIQRLVTDAGFPSSLVPSVARRVLRDRQPTIEFNSEATEELAVQAAAAVEPVLVEHRAGEVLYRRGDVLTPKQYEELVTEQLMFAANSSFLTRWIPRLGIFGLIALVLMFLGVFLLNSYPRVAENLWRLTALGGLVAGLLAVVVVITVQASNLMYPAAIATVLFAAIIVLLAYDRRLALFVSAVLCALAALALEQGVAWFVLLTVGCGMVIAQLSDVRHRSSLIRAATMTSLLLAAGTVLYGFLAIPQVPGFWTRVGIDSAWAVAASYSVGFLVLGILPSIERLFDITTGMTLAELRDPKQPLLRQLQQKAPGTYNHSLQVANLAEAATEAVGGDGLLVYVGALYHDVGKINKPEYFVENQASGYNKHKKLSPAMSLLVVVGHVKDGIELAREYGLPRPVQHFIESHHGTTLVEYFYHAAKSKAETDEKAAVSEVEFRYPGPKPRTREAAILMLSDAVESATRALAEPTPGRIENLVRDLSHKRLVDGQFDESDLTFRELAVIEDAMISRLCAIHHSRIAYPSGKEKDETASGEADVAKAKPA